MSTRPAAHADAAHESLINFERKKKVDVWGMVDSIVLATGRRSKGKSCNRSRTSETSPTRA